MFKANLVAYILFQKSFSYMIVYRNELRAIKLLKEIQSNVV